MPRWVVVHNPGARRGRRVLRAVHRMLSAHSIAVEIRFVSIQDLDACPPNPARVIVVGGDGTFNLTASWLHATNCHAPLAIIPAGTGNNLATGLDLPRRTSEALALAFGGTATRPLDAMVFTSDETQTLMVQSAAFGFPAAVADHYDHWRRRSVLRSLGKFVGTHVYRYLALLRLATERRRARRGEDTISLICRLDDEELEVTVLAVFLGNERTLGGNFVPCPHARVDDGKVDLCLIRHGPRTPYFALFRAMSTGRHLEHGDHVLYRQTTQSMELEFDREVPLLVDGDIKTAAKQYRVDILPGRFQIFVG